MLFCALRLGGPQRFEGLVPRENQLGSGVAHLRLLELDDVIRVFRLDVVSIRSTWIELLCRFELFCDVAGT